MIFEQFCVHPSTDARTVELPRPVRNPRLAVDALFGYGLTRAYDLQEGQQWSGAAVDDDAYRLYEENLKQSRGVESLKQGGFLVDYEVPLKDPGPTELIAVNWSKFSRSPLSQQMVEKAFTMHDKNLDDSAIAKLKNTLDFLAETNR